MNRDDVISAKIAEAKIRRALLSGPDSVTSEATVAEMDAQGKMTVLRPGTNHWTCIAGNENVIGNADMCADPMGMRWMILWPFDASVAGLPTVMRDAGTLVMFAGTPYAHLHVCGSPWDGNEYHPGDRGVWEMTYARP
jgi:hypothetical protein